MRRFAAAAALLALAKGATGVAFGQQVPFASVPGEPAPIAECSREGLSQQLVERCNLLRLESLDAQLNTAYRERLEASGDATRAVIQRSQRDWLKARDNACQLTAAIADRAAWLSYAASSVQRADCIAQKTRDRIQSLRAGPQHAEASPVTLREEPTASPGAYSIRSQRAYRSGRRYFELVIEQGKMRSDRPVEAMVVARVADGSSAAEMTF